MFQKLGARKEQFAVQFEDLVEFGGDVAANDVLNAYPCGLELANLGSCVSYDHCIGVVVRGAVIWCRTGA